MKILTKIRDYFRPVLSDRQIEEYVKKGLLIKNPSKFQAYQPNSVDISLSNEYQILQANKDKNQIDIARQMNCIEGKFKNGKFILKPKQFVLMSSKEYLNIPNGILAFVQGRSSIARLGIQIEQAGLIDAGFQGTITFEIFNQSNYNIHLYEGMHIAQLYFFKAQYANVIYGAERNSKYNNQIGPTESKIYKDFNK